MRWVARRIVGDLRIDIFNQLMRLPISYFDEQSVGVLISKITYDVEQMANAATKSSLTLVRDSLTTVGIVGYMVYLDWRLTMIFVLIAPIMAFYLKSMFQCAVISSLDYISAHFINPLGISVNTFF